MFEPLFSWFTRRIDPFRQGPSDQPPDRLPAFYWRYVRQVWPVILAVMVVGLAASLIEVALFAFVARIVDLVKDAPDPARFFADHGTMLAWMAFVALILRPLFFGCHALLVGGAVAPAFTNLVRYQTHRWVLRQSLSFFQNDFAGRIANKVMQTGPSLRESVVQCVDAIWFMTIYTVSSLVLFLENDWRLTLPLLLWLVLYIATLARVVPKVRVAATTTAEARSMLTGRIVDSYTNMATVKLFAHADAEDDYARAAINEHTRAFTAQQMLVVGMQTTLWWINGILVVATTGLALWLWSMGEVTIGAIALTTGLAIRINNMSGWIMWVVTGLFENIGTVQEGMETIARPHEVLDQPQAPALGVPHGEIRFEQVNFHYGRTSGIIEDLSLRIRPGEKVGLVGRSGAGKSTIVNLLLRFYDLESGRILIDGQDIARIGQESLRAQIGVVTQDTSLLHRSVLENILYGRPDASREAAMLAAAQAHADGFIPDLVDPHGRQGFDAHVGERGVKLSGGQRQRIAIARVLLKDAPILILDEATSALDSEVEAAIQEQLVNLMAGKTVIAIAHRLSTIAAMDRLVILDKGRIIEEGPHDILVRRGGLYAELWARQSGGFLAEAAE